YTPTLFKKEYDCLCVNENNEYFIKDTNKPETKISPCESATEVSDTSDNAVTEVEKEVENAETEVEKEVENAETEVENFFDNAATQVRIGKDRLNKVSLGKESERENARACAQSPPPPTERLGKYENVFLSRAELEELKNSYEDWESRIERLSEYMASSGKSYSSHFATINIWAKQDAQTDSSHPSNEENSSYNLDEFFALAVKRQEQRMLAQMNTG
ncbi:MAG: hypothetical protein IKU52_08080, partial [Clostridia bacterium]|nr:hypothetical protein [Clostridia bacterium]